MLDSFWNWIILYCTLLLCEMLIAVLYIILVFTDFSRHNLHTEHIMSIETFLYHFNILFIILYFTGIKNKIMLKKNRAVQERCWCSKENLQTGRSKIVLSWIRAKSIGYNPVRRYWPCGVRNVEKDLLAPPQRRCRTFRVGHNGMWRFFFFMWAAGFVPSGPRSY